MGESLILQKLKKPFRELKAQEAAKKEFVGTTKQANTNLLKLVNKEPQSDYKKRYGKP